MSSLEASDNSYHELCKSFANRARNAKLHFDATELEDIYDETEDFVPDDFHYSWIVGFRSTSEIMWAIEEEMLYVSNGKIVKSDEEAFRCHYPKCCGRVYLKQNGIAYKVTDHTIDHGSMYKTFLEMQCRQLMRDECQTAGASKSISDIYEEAVIK